MSSTPTARAASPALGPVLVGALAVALALVGAGRELHQGITRWERLGHGYRVEPRIVLWESQSVLKVPLSSLFREGDGWAAFVKRRGRAVLTPVRIGHEDGFDAEVIDGLSEGDVVVLHPSDRVTDGARIAPRGLR